MASEHLINDSQRHSVTVARTGLDLTLTVDSHTLQLSLAYGTPLTLEIDSSEIYTGGSPYATTSFEGCLQDVRIDQFDLPTSGSNSFASVEFEGSEDGLTSITAGCNLSPCFPSPCGSGVCEEMNNSSFQCVCPAYAPSHRTSSSTHLTSSEERSWVSCSCSSSSPCLVSVREGKDHRKPMF